MERDDDPAHTDSRVRDLLLSYLRRKGMRLMLADLGVEEDDALQICCLKYGHFVDTHSTDGERSLRAYLAGCVRNEILKLWEEDQKQAGLNPSAPGQRMPSEMLETLPASGDSEAPSDEEREEFGGLSEFLRRLALSAGGTESSDKEQAKRGDLRRLFLQAVELLRERKSVSDRDLELLVRRIGYGESLSSLAERFGISKHTAEMAYRRSLDRLLEACVEGKYPQRRGRKTTQPEGPASA